MTERYSLKDVITGKVPVIVRDISDPARPVIPDARFHAFVRHAHATKTLEMHQSVGARNPSCPTVYSWALVHVIGLAPNNGSRWMATFEPGTNEIGMAPLDSDQLAFVRQQTAEREAEERALLLEPA